MEGWLGEEGKSLISSTELSLVLSNEVVEGVGFGGEGVVLRVELTLEGVSVVYAFINEVLGFLELFFSSGEFSVSEEELSLEVSVLSVELADSVFELSLGLVFVGNKLVEGVNELVSQVVEGFNDLSDGTLVGEVTFGGEGNKGLDDWGEVGVALELGLDVDEVGLDLLDLDEGWVLELGEEAKALINSLDGLVVLFDTLLEGFVFVLTLHGLGLEVLSVLGDVGIQLSDVVLDALSLGNEDVVDHVVAVEDVSLGSINFLLEADDLAVVLISAAVEVLNELAKLLVEVFNEVVDGVKKLLERTL